jgi:hypothetical protein
LEADPLPALQAADDPALRYWMRRDLLGETSTSLETLWTLPEARALLQIQRPNGSWKWHAKSPSYANYDLLETFRTLRILIVQYGMNCSHPQIKRAAEYVFSCQTKKGDIRGLLGNQYMPYYHGMLLELLIRAGYQGDARVISGLEWLLSVRQDDGGWIVPVQAVPARSKSERLWRGAPVEWDRSLPHSHLATGMALRPLALHPGYREREEVRCAADRLKDRFFRPDRYNDRKSAAYWTKFQYPNWWTNVLMALESLAAIGYTVDDADVQRALAWFVENQERDGLWPTQYDKGRNAVGMRCWVGLAICRVLRSFWGCPQL